MIKIGTQITCSVPQTKKQYWLILRWMPLVLPAIKKISRFGHFIPITSKLPENTCHRGNRTLSLRV